MLESSEYFALKINNKIIVYLTTLSGNSLKKITEDKLKKFCS